MCVLWAGATARPTTCLLVSFHSSVQFYSNDIVTPQKRNQTQITTRLAQNLCLSLLSTEMIKCDFIIWP